MSKVSRSTYQKVVEENKRLLSDIKLLVKDGIPSYDQIRCMKKWREKFSKEKEFHDMLRKAAKQYIKDHADELPDFFN